MKQTFTLLAAAVIATLFNVLAVNAQYCIPTYNNSCATSGSINKFTFNTLDNSASGCNGNADNYILYPASGTTTTQVELGGSYDFTVKSNAADGFGIWIDFNNDNDFDDANEFIYSSPFFDNILFNGTVIIPNDPSYLGERRMRVRGGLQTLIGENDDCSHLNNGETEDYIITIAPAPDCMGTPAAGTITAFPSSICSGGNFSVLHLNDYTVGSGIELQWESSADGQLWTAVTNATADIYLTPPLFDTTWYRVKVTCSISGELAYSNEVKITIGEVQIISVVNDTLCGPGPALLQVDASASVVSWYEDSTGGIPVYTSGVPSVFTPSVDSTTTFYAAASSGVLYIDSLGLTDSTASGSDAYLNDYEIFNVAQECLLVGVYVYPSAPGNVILQLRDKNFNPLSTDTFIIGQSQLNQRVFLELDFKLPPANGYQLTLKDGSVPLWSNQSDVSYPYQIPDVFSIINSNLGPDYFFYFYNWIVNFTDQCETPRLPVTAVVNISPALSISSDPPGATICGNAGLNVNLTASPGYTTYTWSPSTGLSTTSGVHVTAAPSVTTTYTLQAADSVCTNIATVTVTIANTPSVTVTAGSDSICGGTSTQLFATATPLLNYIVDSIAFHPDTLTTGITVLLDEDEVSAPLPIGFPFKFYGLYYDSFKISSNGFITFDTLNFDGCCAGQKLPDIFVPNNLVAFAWEDLSPQLGGSISYFTKGTASQRELIIKFDSVPHYSLTGPADPITAEIILYETSNNIELYTTSMPGNPNGLWFNHTEGIENATGTLGAAVPGRNGSNTWTATNDGWRFTPIEYVYSWLPDATLDNALISDPLASPGSTTTYTVTVSDTATQCAGSGTIKIKVISTPEAGTIIPAFNFFCNEGSDTLSVSGNTAGSLIQWQQASQSGGPYSDIPGATGSSYITPLLDTSIYYVAQVSCINTAATDESMLEVLPVPPPPFGNDVVRCGPGKVDLQATGTGGGISWYDSETGGNYLGSGSPFTTLPINQSTTFWVEEGPPVAMPLSSTFVGGNSGEGNMFDITAQNTIVVTGFEGHIAASQSADIEIYYKKGNYAGFENDKNAWIFAGSAAGVVGQGIGIPTAYPVALNVAIPAGQTFAFYITSKNADINFTYGTLAGNVFASDNNIQLKEGNSIEYPFGNPTEPVQWNGIVHYTTVGCTSVRTSIEAMLYFPQISAAASGNEICEGDTILLTSANNGSGNFNYQWAPVLASMIPANGEGDSVYAAPSISTTFTVTATEVSNTCDTALDVFVLVNPAPLVSFSGLPDTIAITGGAVTLTGFPAGGSFSGAGVNGNIFDPAVAGVGGPYQITYSYTDGNGCSNDTSEYVVVVLEIGIGEKGNDFQLTIYPNPGDGLFIMSLELPFAAQEVSVTVHDIYGQQVFQKKLYPGNKSLSHAFDFSDWPAGNYLMEVIGDGIILKKRISIQR